MAVGDAGSAESALQPHRVSPGVLAAPHAPAPAHVEQQPHVAGTKDLEERLEVPFW